MHLKRNIEPKVKIELKRKFLRLLFWTYIYIYFSIKQRIPFLNVKLNTKKINI